MLKNIKCSGSLGTNSRRWEPPYTQELFNWAQCRRACAIIESNFVHPGDIDNDKVIAGRWPRVDTTIADRMPELYT